MGDNDLVLFKIASLEKLKNEVLLKYLDDINLDFEIDLYDKVIAHFCSGDLDLIYDNNSLKKYSKFDKKKILNVVHEYQDLCFYEKNQDYWIDSIPLVPVEDYNLITYELLDNFDLLVRIYLNAGEDALKLLKDYDKEYFFDKSMSVVENIKRSFVNEDVLIESLKKMTSNKDYDILSDSQKRVLINYAEGNLYNYHDHNVKINDFLDVSSNIYKKATDKNLDKISDKKSHLKEFYGNLDNFSLIVEDIYYDYQNGLSSKNL